MIRENVKKNIDIISAFAEGKTIQYKTDTGSWHDLTENEGLPMGTLGEEPNKFRIKPEQKYRPFKDAGECWNEMQKHQPFGWLISQNGEVNSLIIFIDNEGIVIGDRNNGVIGFVTATDLFKIKFADGIPFGVKEEE